MGVIPFLSMTKTCILVVKVESIAGILKAFIGKKVSLLLIYALYRSQQKVALLDFGDLKNLLKLI